MSDNTALTAPEPLTDYFGVRALSHSGMRDLAVSPLRYWYWHLDPNRVEKPPTPEMQLGSALHCAVLEPDKFDDRYACELIPPEDVLDTIDDLRRALESIGLKAKGAAKGPIIEQVQQAIPNAPILSVLKQQHAELHAGKTIFKEFDWDRIIGMRDSLLYEPKVRELLSVGHAEVPIFIDDLDTGVRLKGKLDWVAPSYTLEFKTFAQKRGKSIDRSIADAIFYEEYYQQAYHYARLRGWPKDFSGEHIMPFVESEEPYEVRIRVLRPKTGGQVNMYWQRAMMQCRALTRTYKEYMDHFGPDNPWRYAQDANPLVDEELKGLAFD